MPLSVARALALSAALVVGAALPAAAQDMNATIIVPDAPKGARFTGCYRIAEDLYGPYRMRFCLQQQGSYRVKGQGVTCNGELNWSARGRIISIDLKRTSCGNGVAWTADTITCQGTTLFGKGVKAKIGEVVTKIIVPDFPTISGLACTYFPNLANAKPKNVTAQRVD